MFSAIIGNFDGVHQGHQQLIKHCITTAKKHQLQSCAILFTPHPRSLLNMPNKRPITLMSNNEKADFLKSLGIEVIHFLDFNPTLMALNPQTFIDEYLIKQFHCSHLTVGANFRFGHHREGDVATLQADPRLTVHKKSLKSLDDKTLITSTQLRALLQAYDFQAYQKLCNHPFYIQGPVIKGQGLANSLGCPTANIALNRDYFPLQGIFTAWATLPNQKTYPAIAYLSPQSERANVPTPWCEVHLLNYNADLYGQTLKISFIERLRPHINLTTHQDLKRQIKKDLAQANSFFVTNKSTKDQIETSRKS
jgi:riboflavin kinase / FMN adenylyltransferase